MQNVGSEAAQAARQGLLDSIVISADTFMRLRDVGEYFDQAVPKIESGEWTAEKAMQWVQEQVEKK